MGQIRLIVQDAAPRERRLVRRRAAGFLENPVSIVSCRSLHVDMGLTLRYNLPLQVGKHTERSSLSRGRRAANLKERNGKRLSSESSKSGVSLSRYISELVRLTTCETPIRSLKTLLGSNRCARPCSLGFEKRFSKASKEKRDLRSQMKPEAVSAIPEHHTSGLFNSHELLFPQTRSWRYQKLIEHGPH